MRRCRVFKPPQLTVPWVLNAQERRLIVTTPGRMHQDPHVLVGALVALLVRGVVYLPDDQLWLTSVEPPTRYRRSLSKPAAGPWPMRNPTACTRCWPYPGAAETLSLRPVRVLFYGAYVSRRVSSPGRPHYYCIDTESNRGDGFNVSHKSLRVKLAMPPGSVPLRQPDYQDGTCVWAPNSTGVLDDRPRALGDCRGPSKKKSPPSIMLCRCANTYIWRRGWTTSRMGPSEWIRLKRNLLTCV